MGKISNSYIQFSSLARRGTHYNITLDNQRVYWGGKIKRAFAVFVGFLLLLFFLVEISGENENFEYAGFSIQSHYLHFSKLHGIYLGVRMRFPLVYFL